MVRAAFPKKKTAAEWPPKVQEGTASGDGK